MTPFLRTLWYVLSLRCEEADRIQCAERCGDLTRRERVAVRLHRLLCASCRKARRQLGQLSTLLQDLDQPETGAVVASSRPPTALPPDARARIESRLRRASGGGPAGGATGTEREDRRESRERPDR